MSNRFTFRSTWLIAALALCGAARGEGAAAKWMVVTPQAVEHRLEQRRGALRAAMKRTSVPLWSEEFDDRPAGPLGAGVHGEWAIAERVLLGYSGRSERGEDLGARLERGALHLIDRRRDGSIYARLPVGEASGRLAFDVLSPRGEPITITLGAYQGALVVPGEDDWVRWFKDRPHAAHFVYLAGTGAGYRPTAAMRDNYRAIDTGVAMEAAKRHRVVLAWDVKRRTASIHIDGRDVIRDARLLSNTGELVEFVTIRPGSFLNDGRYDDGEIEIDNVKADALVWSKGVESK